MASKIPDITWAVGHSFNLYVGLQGPGWPYVLGKPLRGDLRLWTPRARATDVGQGPHLRRGVPAGSLRAMEPRAREKPRDQKRKKCRCALKTHLCKVIQGSPSGCVWREIPGVTQVDGKGHEGDTAVVTAYLFWRKHGQRNSRTGGVPADYYYSLWTLFQTKKRQLWDRGCRRNSSLQALWDTWIARTTGFVWPHQGC